MTRGANAGRAERLSGVQVGVVGLTTEYSSRPEVLSSWAGLTSTAPSQNCAKKDEFFFRATQAVSEQTIT